MRNLKTLTYFSLITVIISSITLFNCSKKNSNKIPITTKSDKALEYYNEGLTLADNFRGQEAVYYYLKAIAEDPDFAMGYLQLAMVQTTPKLTFKYFDRAKANIKNVSDGEELLILAMEAGINNDQEKQNNYYVELLELYPNDERTHNTYANFLFNLQNYQEAIKYYETALKINPNLAQPYNMLGYSFRRLKNFEEAENYFKKYLDIIQDNPNSYDSYAELLMEMGKFETSIEYYRQALAIQPNFIFSVIGIASNLTLLNRHEAACQELETIETLSKDPGDLKRMHFAKAVVNVDRGNFEKALAELKMNVTISKDIEDDLALGQDLINIGTVQLMAGNHEDALKYYEKSMDFFERADISQELKYYVRRQLFVSAGRVAFFKKDIESLRKFKDKYEFSAKKTMNMNEIRNAHELTGHIYLLEENYLAAISEYKQANLQNPILLYLIGTAYEELGDHAEAHKTYEQVAHFNSLNDLNYAFIRRTALEKLSN